MSLTDVTEELVENAEAILWDAKAELKLLQFPRPLSGRRSDTNSNKTSTTKTASSTLLQHQVLRYLNQKRKMQEEKKRMQVNQDMADKTQNQEKVQMTIIK